jgi:hypothetical protein
LIHISAKRMASWLLNRWITTSSVQHQHAMELQQLQMFNVTPKTDKKVVQVQRSSMISEYNRYMGGTDLLDHNVSKTEFVLDERNGGGRSLHG